MTIGIFYVAQKSGGGGYQYAISVLESLKNRHGDKLFIINLSPDLPNEYRHQSNIEVYDYKTENNKSIFIKILNKCENIFRSILLNLHAFNILNIWDTAFRTKPFNKIINKNNIDIMIFPTPYNLASQLKIPTVAPIFDLHHRFSKRFPEVGTGRAYLNKEYQYSQIAKKTSIILVDSEISREDVSHVYKVPKNKIVALPVIPSNNLDPNMTKEQALEILKKLKLPDKFLFYPAQLWPHKNHINIIKAIKILKDKGININVVFSGTQKNQWGVMEILKQYISENNLENNVIYLNYVEDKIISALYKTATALIMPTFFGPTNIPVTEAWVMGCPVIYSNITGCREQLGDAGLLVDPNNPDDMADKIMEIWDNKSLQMDLINKGYIRVQNWTFPYFMNKLNNIIDNLN